MKTHSPGPWHVDLDTTIASVKSADGKAVARCYQGDYDAALIAAAPEMLDALRLALTCLDAAADGRLEDVKDEIGGTANIVDEVITKATN
jgi:hypothetical protein